MAAPSPTVRVSPSGIKLRDGFSSLVTFATDADISLWEMEVTPPGVDGGPAIPQTTMHNDDFETFAAQQLKTMTESGFKFAYDPAVYDELFALVNVPTTITKQYNDGSTLAFYGYLRQVQFDPLVKGTQPTGTATIQPTNYDHVNNVEAGPVMTSVSGT